MERVEWSDGLISVGRGVGPSGAVRLRTFETPRGLGLRPDLAVDLARFLAGATRQAVVAERSEYWLRVLETGRHGIDGFVATEPAATTLQGVVDRRVGLLAEDLHWIVSGVLTGLLDYHEATGSAMGSLGLRTVTLSEAATLRSRVRLTDPGPVRAGDPSQVDGPALGQLIVRVVEGLDERAEVHPPIRKGPSWARLGRSGGAWLALANELLDPRAAARGELPALADVASRLPKEPLRWHKPAAIAGGSLVMAGALAWVLVMVFYTRPLQEAEVQPLKDALRVLNREYSGWVQDYAESSARVDDRIRAWDRAELARLAAENASVAEAVQSLRMGLLEPLDQVGDAWERAGSIFNSQSHWVDDPESRDPRPTTVQRFRLDLAIEETGIEEMKSRFTGERFDEIVGVKQALLWARTFLAEEWPVYQALDASAGAFGGRGWDAAAGQIRGLLDRQAQLKLDEADLLEPRRAFSFAEFESLIDGYPQPSFAGVAGVLRLRADTERLESLWDEVERVENRLAADSLGENSRAALGAFDDRLSALVAARGGEPGITGQPRGVGGGLEVLEEHAALIDQMAALGGERFDQIDWAAVASDQAVAQAAWAGASLDDFAGWLTTVEGYLRLGETDDPRRVLAARGPIQGQPGWDEMEQDLTRWAEEIRAEDALQEADEMEAGLEGLRSARILLAGMPWVVRYEEQLRGEALSLDGVYRELYNNSEQTHASVLVKPSAYLPMLASYGDGLETFPAAQALWRGESEGITVAQLENDPDRYRAFRKKMDALQQLVEGLRAAELRLPEMRAPRVEASEPDVDRGAYVRAAELARDEIRGQVLAAWEERMAAEDWANTSRGVMSREVDGVLAGAQAELDAWGQRADLVLGAFESIAADLDLGALLDEPGRAGVGPIVERTKTAEGLEAYRAVEPVVAPVLRRLAAVQHLEDRAAVRSAGGLAAALDTEDLVNRPELISAAWRRLVAGSAAVEILDAAVSFRLADELLRATGAWADTRGETDMAHVRDRVAAQAPAVWERLADRVDAAAVMEFAADVRTEFGVDDEGLPDRLRWNVALADFAEEMRGLELSMDDPAEAVGKRVVGAFESAHRGLGIELQDRSQDPAEVEDFLLELTGITSDEPVIPFDELGPARLNGEAAGELFRYREDLAEFAQPGNVPTRVVYEYLGGLRIQDPAGPGDGRLLEFTRVTAVDEPPVLLARSEVSIQLAAVALGASGPFEAQQMQMLEVLFDPSEHGVVVWQAMVESGQVLRSPRLTQTWMTRSQEELAAEPFRPGVVPEVPNSTMPLQRVSAVSAWYVARLLGCRLPTPDEYRGAVTLEHETAQENELWQRVLDPRVSLQPNLRDASWDDHQQYCLEQRASGELFMIPHMETFGAEAESDQAVPVHRPTGQTYADGRIWFEPTGGRTEAKSFEHLLGNVAEWVSTETQWLAVDPTEPVPMPTEDDWRQILLADPASGRGVTTQVAGGSAASTPARGLVSVDPVAANERWVRPQGYADVGMRLALEPVGRFKPIGEHLLAFTDRAYVLWGE